jgi:hypothetical protein
MQTDLIRVALVRRARIMVVAVSLLGGASIIGSYAAAAAPRNAHAPASPLGRAYPGAGATLYSAAFKATKLKGWSADKAAWRVNGGGKAIFNGLGTGQMLAPFSTGRTRDFAVEAKIEAVRPSSLPDSGYGVEVRGAWPLRGIAAGSHFSATLELNEPLLMWGRDSVGGSDVTLSPGYNTYRLEVHNRDYTLYVDGHRTVRFRVGSFSKGTKVGLWSMNQQILVASFKVMRLKAAKPLVALPAIEAVDLQPQDVGSGLVPGAGHFSTNEELARLDKVSLVELAGAGDVISYHTVYTAPSLPGWGPTSVTGEVYAFSSPQMAENDLTARVTSVQRSWSGNTNYATSSVSGLGQEAHALGFEYFAGSYDGTQISVTVRDGSIEVAIYVNFVQGGGITRSQLVAQVIALAKIVDGRIQQKLQRGGM